MSASPYVLIAASTAVVGTLLVTELIRRSVGAGEEEPTEDTSSACHPQPSIPSIDEIEAEDFSQYEHVADVLAPPNKDAKTVHRAGKRVRSRRRRIGKRLERKILKMWKEGIPARKIAEELGLSYSAVYRRIKKFKEGVNERG